ncbi:hypothetical protein ASE85_08005 [Sphingobium sp. Leaf26]|nr:hypothetical protein ASE85_08005 [Sphingobium sp. Leaf26]
MVRRLSDGQVLSIMQLGEGMAIGRQAVANHLDVLHDADLAHRRKSGREVRYTLHPDAMDAARLWLEHASTRWDDMLARLKALMEED